MSDAAAPAPAAEPVTATAAAAGQSSQQQPSKVAPAVLVIGMAGAGKSMVMQRLSSHLSENRLKTYGINLDPAVVGDLSFPANIDIRDTIHYKKLMEEHNLGPNGAIVLSLNLFTTQFDQLSNLLAQRALENDFVLIDTPGQIEIFTWSAGGAIICDALASRLPTCVVYVVDTVRCQNPVTFMSNMLYTCSILYKTQLPFVVVFNKTDIVKHDFAVEWMRDFEAFEEAVSRESSYTSGLARSLSLVLDEFYSNLRVVGISAARGDGMNDLVEAINEASAEFERDYRPKLEQLRKEKEAEEAARQQAQLNKFAADKNAGMKVAMNLSDAATAVSAAAGASGSRKAQVKLSKINYGKGSHEEYDSDDSDSAYTPRDGLSYMNENEEDEDDADDDEAEGDEYSTAEEAEKERLQFESFKSFLASQNASSAVAKKPQ
ncbi:XPA binding protein 1 [Capsaspora owczarzaki ATCC 30864]|uniref:GPN-loop GTPase n=1 Tax=Capsaspora owczarzaki (strain ATCC 30864) TaxID=595528 RepID=A0A0D2VFY2_CAPO3|nr:XPA binding protein 1 [Capsaspora owczarzaki ATCC 30864]KJE88672.1 XPA binding protein 1 [Capsaspora owczarzaki ATCC 30864]|eukprot:XP_004365150.1 XPA binding protein 1 [Capsaspora owczarzaki ATCC 30864]